jgi:hypothetical protein
VGLLRRMAASATGATGIQRATDKVLEDIERLAAEGRSSFTVQFGQSDIGTINRLDVAGPMVIEAVQAAGHSVTSVDYQPWSYTVYLTIEPGRATARRSKDGEQRYGQALEAANAAFAQQGIYIRAAGVREDFGELQVAVVCPGEEDLRTSLDQLPGPEAVKAVVDEAFAFRGLEVVASYHNERTWRRAREELDWIIG